MMVCHAIPATDLELGSQSDSGVLAAPMSAQQETSADKVSAGCVRVVSEMQAAQAANKEPAACRVCTPSRATAVPDVGVTRALHARRGSSAVCGCARGTCGAGRLHEHCGLRRQKGIVRPEFFLVLKMREALEVNKLKL